MDKLKNDLAIIETRMHCRLYFVFGVESLVTFSNKFEKI